MSKTTKILTTVVAIALVITAMVVGIYAATQGAASINATVSWSAEAGIAFTLNGNVNNGVDEAVAMGEIKVTAATDNATAGANARTLTSAFKDNNNDGVNDPKDVVFTFTFVNTGSTSIDLKVTGPATANESGTNETTHTPKIAWTYGGADQTVTAEGFTKTVANGDTATIVCTLSLAKSGTGSINADTGIKSFSTNFGFTMTKTPAPATV